LELVHKRQSTRIFRPDVVAPGDIEKMLEAARWAMSGANAQPWEFVVVDDAEVKKHILTSWPEARKETYDIEQTRLPELRHPNFHNLEASPGFKDAHVFIIVLGDRRVYQATVLAANYLWGEGGTDSTYLKNIGNATHNLHLAAAALGLGTQWVSVNRIWGETLKQILGIPDIFDVHTLVAVGYPASPPRTGYRRPLKHMVHLNHYETEKYRSAEEIRQFIYELRQSTRASYARYDKQDSINADD
ncbi:MAG: nitroreductase family protein, partial [Dehalococcoidia bacterium]|nr:nitroreductase family protein [Dehalococcoidia bacterium]